MEHEHKPHIMGGHGDLLKKGSPAPDPGGRGIFREVKHSGSVTAGHTTQKVGKACGFGHHGGMHQGVHRTSGHSGAHQIGKRKKR